MPHPCDVESPPPTRTEHRIAAVHVTPVAFRDRPLLNTVGTHEPFALRTIIEVVTDDGIYGLGETYGDRAHVRRLERSGRLLIGSSVFDLNGMRRAVREALRTDNEQGGHGMSGMVMDSSTPDRVFSPFEVAAHDIQGKLLGVPVSELLGGALRDRVTYSGYLFYKWSGHPGHDDDEWGGGVGSGGNCPSGAVPHRRVRLHRNEAEGRGFRA